ncbi:unnamed protein product [Effrenium voratum]|uniref:Uncharacterized protein n=1 Tax=Effrenium voratum TaxID=2562239 RepID=A0AA36J8Q1_9DINO|nr:unnamed protein product [Effrenium voratum]
MCRTDRQELRHAKIDVSLEALLSRACALLSDDKDKEAVCVNHTGSFECDADLNRYSILQELPLARRMELIELGSTDAVLNRAMGAMVGMAVGDALGAPLECLHAQDVPVATHFDLESFQFVGRTTGVLKPGQWTDDASMGLCLADSLLLKHRLLGSPSADGARRMRRADVGSQRIDGRFGSNW